MCWGTVLFGGLLWLGVQVVCHAFSRAFNWPEWHDARHIVFIAPRVSYQRRCKIRVNSCWASLMARESVIAAVTRFATSHVERAPVTAPTACRGTALAIIMIIPAKHFTLRLRYWDCLRHVRRKLATTAAVSVWNLFFARTTMLLVLIFAGRCLFLRRVLLLTAEAIAAVR